MARNWARGEPPPEDSWEWVGVAIPPKRHPHPVAKKPVVAAAPHHAAPPEPKKMGVGKMLGYVATFAGGVYVGSIFYGSGK